MGTPFIILVLIIAFSFVLIKYGKSLKKELYKYDPVSDVEALIKDVIFHEEYIKVVVKIEEGPKAGTYHELITTSLKFKYEKQEGDRIKLSALQRVYFFPSKEFPEHFAFYLKDE